MSDETNDQIFSIEVLAEELNHPAEYRRDAARHALHALKELADERSRAQKLPREQIWNSIFDRGRLLAEIEGNDRARRRLAWEVLDALSHVAELRAMDGANAPSSIEDRVWAISVCREWKHNIDERKRELGITPEPRLQN
jgi:hypothetical protein